MLNDIKRGFITPFLVMKHPLPQRSDSIEKQFFEAVCLLLVVVMGYLSIQSFFNLGISPLLVVDLGMVLIGAAFYVFSRFLNLFQSVKYLFILLIYLACTYFWFQLNGVNGSTPYAMIAGAVIAILISDTGSRRYVFILTLIWIISLVYIQQLTAWVQLSPYKPELLFNNFLIFALAIIIILYFIKSKFDQERLRVNKKNEELAKLNQILNQTLTEKEEIIRQLRKTREDLLESEKLAAIGKLTSGLAHELNNPLNYIGGMVTPLRNNLEELQQSIDPKHKEQMAELLRETNDLLDSLTEGSKKASAVIKNLVKLSPQQTEQPFEKFSVGQVLQHHLAILSRTHQDITFDHDMDLSLMIHGNPLDIRQLCLQLLHNSISAVDGLTDKKINVTLKKRDKSLVLEITDNGKGISEENLSRIFDPFISSEPDNPGKGIGMYMSHAAVKKHFGQIKIESEEQQGTTVSVFLPLA